MKIISPRTFAPLVGTLALVALAGSAEANTGTGKYLSRKQLKIVEQVAPAYPRLADKDYAVGILVTGKGGMPWFTDILSQQQIAAVLTHVRSRFNAYPDPVTEADVQRIVAASAKTGGEE